MNLIPICKFDNNEQFKNLQYLKQKKEEFTPLNKNSVGMYVCGPTVYDEPHIGNARPLIIFDLVYRILIKNFGKSKVNYVRNITDIDDKIIQRANELKIDIFPLLY